MKKVREIPKHPKVKKRLSSRILKALNGNNEIGKRPVCKGTGVAEIPYKMKIVPIELKQANKFVHDLHRHHKPVQGHKFSIGLLSAEKLVGVAICGRPVSRHLDTGYILEVTRLCTDGTKNACSKLYSACARIARELGYDKIITYILDSETGNSLIATGWECEATGIGGKKWSGTLNNGTKRTDIKVDLFGEERKYPNEMKQRWSKTLSHVTAQQKQKQEIVE